MIYGVDICGTLADILTPLAGYLLKKGEVRGLQEVLRHYHSPVVTPQLFKENPEIFSNAKPFRGAAKHLNALAKTNGLFYVTAREEWARHITESWLRKNGFPKAPVIMGHPKAEVVKEYNIDIAIEDAPHEIKGLIKICRVLVHKQTYNTGFAERFTWKEGVAA